MNPDRDPPRDRPAPFEPIRLDTHAFEGPTNAYLLCPGTTAPTALIDTGIATPEVASQLWDGLAAHGVDVTEIERVYLTHFHFDHAGLAGEIQRRADATVYAHPADAPLVGGGSDTISRLVDGIRDHLGEWSVPADAREELLASLDAHTPLAGEPVEVTPLDPGTPIDHGSYELDVVPLPGHTRGHVGYGFGGGHLVCGDALLPVYTPNIGGADVRLSRPLACYLGTLSSLARGDIVTAWPGHRHRIGDPAARVHELREHHRERLCDVIETLEEYGPSDVWSVAGALFGPLEGIHILHGPGEVAAHLQHLVDAGAAIRTDKRYRLGPESIPMEDLVPFESP